MEPVTLTTERLLLRPLAPTDVDTVHAACQDPAIRRWILVPDPYTREDAEEFVARLGPAGWRDDTAYNFALVTRTDGELVGAMGLVGLDQLAPPRRTAEIGYWTAREHRRRGLTSEAARAVAEWAFRHLGVERLEWYAEVGNEASWAVARKVGFHPEGTLRARLVRQGTRRDAWLGALLPSDLGLSPPPGTASHLPAATPADQTGPAR